MGTSLSLTASDGFRLGAYRADPSGAPQGGVVVVQEIFGVNHHIRAVCDRLAAVGYAAHSFKGSSAPALFDRQQRDFQSGYTPDEVAAARKFVASPDVAAFLRDTQPAIDVLKATGPVSVIGFCLGGSIAFLSATRFEGVSSAVCFYGGMIAKFADEKPKCPTQMHFGEKDEHIPMTDVAAIRAKRSDCDILVYPAGHGFYCDERASYHQPSAALAWDRTLAWLRRGRDPAAKK